MRRWAMPNEVPLSRRIRNIFLVVSLLVYAGYSMYIDEIIIPTENGILYVNGNLIFGVHLAIICAVIVLLLEVADHYDKRANESKYEKWSSFFNKLGNILFFGTLIINLILS
ncbi:hypothetical protein [Photobacterium nomapromontoriensis]|uniref:hypothetical protein n=1 Tax=Photobacterium nomapromontoriensis TaxID=2910237 RepID=UPI003D109C5E